MNQLRYISWVRWEVDDILREQYGCSYSYSTGEHMQLMPGYPSVYTFDEL